MTAMELGEPSAVRLAGMNAPEVSSVGRRDCLPLEDAVEAVLV